MPVFADRPGTELRLLARCMDELPLEPGQVLIRKGHSNAAFFVLLDGEVEVQVRGQRHRRLTAGEFFGEISMETMGPATATVVARTRGRALVMGRSQYRAVRGSTPVRARLMSAMSARLEADNRPRSASAVAQQVEVERPAGRSVSGSIARGAGRLGRWFRFLDTIDVYRPYCPGCYGPGGCAIHSPANDWRAGL